MSLPTSPAELVDAEIMARRTAFAMRLTRTVFVVDAVLAVVVMGAWLLIPGYTQLLILSIMLAQMMVVALLYPALRKRSAGLANSLFLFSFWLGIAASVPLIPDILPAAGLAFLNVVILGLMLLGRVNVALIVLCAAGFIANVILVRLGLPGWFTPLDEQVGLVLTIAFATVSLPATAFTLVPIFLGQEGHSRQVRLAQLEIERRADLERSQQRRLESVVRVLLDHMGRVTEGNLSQPVTLDEPDGPPDDPLTLLAGQLNEMTTRLRCMIDETRQAAANMRGASADILAAMRQQMAGTGEQSAATAQMTTTVDEVKVIADQSVARAQEVADAAQRTMAVSERGGQAVQASIGSMARIKGQVEEIAENILALSARTQQIGTIITVVNELAAQSNMLALNAAVEAARAGEKGKGFAVVAHEVRSLAEQSRQATRQVRDILEEIQKATNRAVMATETGIKGADEGGRLATQAGEAIGQLAAAIDESAQVAAQMVAGGRQQAAGIEQIALAMRSIQQATAQGLASTRQTEQAARDLDSLSSRLAQTVAQYQL